MRGAALRQKKSRGAPVSLRRARDDNNSLSDASFCTDPDLGQEFAKACAFRQPDVQRLLSFCKCRTSCQHDQIRRANLKHRHLLLPPNSRSEVWKVEVAVAARACHLDRAEEPWLAPHIYQTQSPPFPRIYANVAFRPCPFGRGPRTGPVSCRSKDLAHHSIGRSVRVHVRARHLHRPDLRSPHCVRQFRRLETSELLDRTAR